MISKTDKSSRTYNPQYHFNTPKIISIILKLYSATVFRMSYYNLNAVTLPAEGNQYFLMNNCSWNHPQTCISHSLT